MGQPAIAVHELRKSFGAKQAVAGIDLEIAAGSFAGLVGPNGAGKTTSLSMMTGLLRPDGGRVLINGLDVWADPPAAKAIIGVVPAEARLFERLSGEELLEYAGRLRGMPPARPARGPSSCSTCSTWPRTPSGWSPTTPPACARKPCSDAP
jgi:ABC-2 type transport system ATP-binding protein